MTATTERSSKQHSSAVDVSLSGNWQDGVASVVLSDGIHEAFRHRRRFGQRSSRHDRRVLPGTSRFAGHMSARDLEGG
jgi:hypothetical protein